MLGGHFSITMLGQKSSLIWVEHPESVHTAVSPWKSFVRGLHTDTIFPIFRSLRLQLQRLQLLLEGHDLLHEVLAVRRDGQ